jgi:hypothetical protein
MEFLISLFLFLWFVLLVWLYRTCRRIQTYQINKTNQMNERNAIYLWCWLNQRTGRQLLVQHRQFPVVPLEDFSQASTWPFPFG